ncbi:MAG: hypothetical protein QM729_07580 [Solirubrobacterales bacterium]
MPQIMVVTEAAEGEVEAEVVYSENVGAVHLEGHAGAQLVERLRWAVRDAQVAEHRALTGPAPEEGRGAAA